MGKMEGFKKEKGIGPMSELCCFQFTLYNLYGNNLNIIYAH